MAPEATRTSTTGASNTVVSRPTYLRACVFVCARARICMCVYVCVFVCVCVFVTTGASTTVVSRPSHLRACVFVCFVSVSVFNVCLRECVYTYTNNVTPQVNTWNGTWPLRMQGELSIKNIVQVCVYT